MKMVLNMMQEHSGAIATQVQGHTMNSIPICLQHQEWITQLENNLIFIFEDHRVAEGCLQNENNNEFFAKSIK